LEPRADGTRFTYDHTGFTGVSGLFMSKLLGQVRTKMLDKGLPPVLDDLDDDGKLRPGSTATSLRLRNISNRRNEWWFPSPRPMTALRVKRAGSPG
ncbi:MAG: hypothetical protein ACRDOI_33675, partial [Trebonia sp.]